MIEYRFNFPEFYPAPPGIARNIRLSMLRERSFATLQSSYSYESQENPDECFRTTEYWHVDNANILRFQQLEMCASSTPTIFAEGAIAIDENVHRAFSKRTYTARSAIAKLGSEFCDENWLDGLIEAEIAPEDLVGVHIVDEFKFIQAKPFEIARGLVQQTLHKSAPRMADDPTFRTFYRKFFDFKLRYYFG